MTLAASDLMPGWPAPIQTSSDLLGNYDAPCVVSPIPARFIDTHMMHLWDLANDYLRRNFPSLQIRACSHFPPPWPTMLQD
jgi:hypothetical protein